MPRLFVALELPDSVKRSLEPMARGLGDVRWATPDQQHLTLRFIGEVGNGVVQIQLNEHTPVLRAGDALLVTHDAINGWRNLLPEPARLFWIVRD